MKFEASFIDQMEKRTFTGDQIRDRPGIYRVLGSPAGAFLIVLPAVAKIGCPLLYIDSLNRDLVAANPELWYQNGIQLELYDGTVTFTMSN